MRFVAVLSSLKPIERSALYCCLGTIGLTIWIVIKYLIQLFLDQRCARKEAVLDLNVFFCEDEDKKGNPTFEILATAPHFEIPFSSELTDALDCDKYIRFSLSITVVSGTRT